MPLACGTLAMSVVHASVFLCCFLHSILVLVFGVCFEVQHSTGMHRVLKAVGVVHVPEHKYSVPEAGYMHYTSSRRVSRMRRWCAIMSNRTALLGAAALFIPGYYDCNSLLILIVAPSDFDRLISGCRFTSPY